MIAEPKDHNAVWFVRYVRDGLNCTSTHVTETSAKEKADWVRKRGGTVKYIRKFVAEDVQ